MIPAGPGIRDKKHGCVVSIIIFSYQQQIILDDLIRINESNFFVNFNVDNLWYYAVIGRK